MSAPLQPLAMVEMNDLVAREFRRIFLRDSSLELPRWWATRMREVIALQDACDLHRATARWASLTRAEQQCRFLSYLRSLPRAPLPVWSSAP